MGKSKDLATGAAYQDQTESDARYVNVAGDTMSGDLNVGSGGIHVTSPTGIQGLIVDTDQSNTNVSGRIVLKNANDASSVYYSDSLGWTFHTGTVLGSTSGTQRAYLTPQGYLRTPYQPAFMSYKNGQHTESSGVNRVESWTEHFDVGGHFDNSTGRFVAPIAGKYFFTFNAMHSGTVSGDLQFRIFKNGSIYIGSNDTSDGGSWDQCTVVAIMDMAVNDYAEPYQYSSATSSSVAVYSGQYSGWMGYLLG